METSGHGGMGALDKPVHAALDFSVRSGGILPLWQHESRKFCIRDLTLIEGFLKDLTTGEDTEKHQKSSAHEIMNFKIFNLSRA